jgi:mycothiol synthase
MDMSWFDPRPYQGDTDLALMRQILTCGRQVGGLAYYVHVGDLNWWLFYLHQELDREKTIFIWDGPDPDAEARGWFLFSPDYGSFDLFIHPRSRAGVQVWSMLQWAVAQATRMVRAGGGDQVSTMWIAEQDGPFITGLEEQGFKRGNDYLLHMVRPLEETVPPAPLPSGYRVRHVAGEHEAAQRAVASHAAFASSWSFEHYLERYIAFMRAPVYVPDLDLMVVTPEGRCAAFCICWLDPVNRVGLFEPVGTHPEYQRRGLAKAVLAEGLRRMRAGGMRQAAVCVDHDNLGAQRLYTSLGFQPATEILQFVKRL